MSTSSLSPPPPAAAALGENLYLPIPSAAPLVEKELANVRCDATKNVLQPGEQQGAISIPKDAPVAAAAAAAASSSSEVVAAETTITTSMAPTALTSTPPPSPPAEKNTSPTLTLTPTQAASSPTTNVGVVDVVVKSEDEEKEEEPSVRVAASAEQQQQQQADSPQSGSGAVAQETSSSAEEAMMRSPSSPTTVAVATVAAAATPITPTKTTTTTTTTTPPRSSSSSSTRRTAVTATASSASSSWPWKQCNVHRPTLQELQSQSFSDYVRKTVMRGACYPPGGFSSSNDKNDKDNSGGDDDDSDDDDSYYMSTEMPLVQGMAKVVLPPELWKQHQRRQQQHQQQQHSEEETGENPILQDRSGRSSAAWQAGGMLGDFQLSSPMQQNIRGIGGVYEYTFTDQSPLTLAEFRIKADEYRTQQVGCAVDDDKNDNAKMERMAHLERLFWKRLGPTMPPAWYGADQEGSFFDDDSNDNDNSDVDDSNNNTTTDTAASCCGWSLRHMDSCLHVLSRVPGVTSPYLYFGMWASCFGVHTEDMNLLSINYLHAGSPKLWYAVSPKDAARLEALAESYYPHSATRCKEFLRHKRCLLSPKILKRAGIAFTTTIQYPGEAVITMPNAYHFGFNSGFNVAEATNLAVPEWIPFGRKAHVCLCRPDSVRIDMDRFLELLHQYQADQKRRRKGARLSWKEWGEKQEEEQTRQKEEAAMAARKKTKQQGKKGKLSDQQRRHEFWVEVMKPVGALSGRAPGATGASSSSSKKRKKKGEKQPKKEEEEDVWHLAQPIVKKRLNVESKVLVILPATTSLVAVKKRQKTRLDKDDDPAEHQQEQHELDEQCFAGEISEISGDHARVHLVGLPKSEDVWMLISDPKLFADGGKWTEEKEEEGMPPLHYWQEMDSNERCMEE